MTDYRLQDSMIQKIFTMFSIPHTVFTNEQHAARLEAQLFVQFDAGQVEIYNAEGKLISQWNSNRLFRRGVLIEPEKTKTVITNSLSETYQYIYPEDIVSVRFTREGVNIWTVTMKDGTKFVITV